MRIEWFFWEYPQTWFATIYRSWFHNLFKLILRFYSFNFYLSMSSQAWEILKLNNDFDTSTQPVRVGWNFKKILQSLRYTTLKYYFYFSIKFVFVIVKKKLWDALPVKVAHFFLFYISNNFCWPTLIFIFFLFYFSICRFARISQTPIPYAIWRRIKNINNKKKKRLWTRKSTWQCHWMNSHLYLTGRTQREY